MSTSRLDVLLAETGLDPADHQALLALEEMLALVPDEAPRPYVELQAVLDSGTSTARRSGHSLGTGVAAGLVSLVVTVGIGGVAAAADELPPGMQRVVSQWSHRHLPFAFPMPRASAHTVPSPARPGPARPAPVATVLPAPHRPSPSTASTGRLGDARVTPATRATPAARADASSSAADGAGASGSRRAGTSSAPSTRRAPHGAAAPGQEPSAATGDRGEAGANAEHPTGPPTGVPAAAPQRQDVEHRADGQGSGSAHRRSVATPPSASPRSTPSDRSGERAGPPGDTIPT